MSDQIRYLALRVAPLDEGVNARIVKIDKKCSLFGCWLLRLPAEPAGSCTAVPPPGEPKRVVTVSRRVYDVCGLIS
ncbi:MAG: hypothetical protein ABSD44_09060 [Terracidiphilus sp.]